MRMTVFDSLALLDTSGHAIIIAILATLLVGVLTTFSILARYASIRRELEKHAAFPQSFEQPVLQGILRDVDLALRTSREVNTQAIIENNFQTRLSGLLVGERFVKAATGLLIILGLVGTFYGLTSSIGRLVALITGNSPTTDVGQALTSGLTQALSGMSVAFTASLFGIVSAIIMTLLGVFANVADRRTAVMTQIEAYIDNIKLAPATQAQHPGGALAPAFAEGITHAIAQLETSIARFDSALQNFATTTRDFREFNLHLKDNVQRMSLSFGDFSESLKTQIAVLKGRGQS